MKSDNKSEPKKKQVKKLQPKEKTANKSVKELRKGNKEDTDFHHVHPFREQ